MTHKKGKLVLFSGPSGVGKDTLLDIVLERDTELRKSVSMTTRAMREGETDGVDYHFVTPQKFEALVAENGVLEYAKYGKSLYGTPKAPVDAWLNEGKNVILKIEVQGAAKVKEICRDAVGIFIMPPSIEILEERLRGRGTETEEDLLRRIKIAKGEIEKRSDYDYIVVNDDLNRSVDEVLHILRSI